MVRVVDDLQTVTIILATSVAEFVGLRLVSGMDVWDILAGEQPIVKSGSPFYLEVDVKNAGTTTGTVWIRLTDDTGTVLDEASVSRSPGDIAYFDSLPITMPNRNYVITVEIGHIE